MQYTTIDSDGYGEEISTNFLFLKRKLGYSPSPFFLRAELNAIEFRPPHMDDSGRTKYPVLFRVYADLFSFTVIRRKPLKLTH